ncbi:hypothetical protein [Butyrivibrio sp. YAB3001]|nr:hypothetical protein [Butyrivibrio sp. YAB3001]
MPYVSRQKQKERLEKLNKIAIQQMRVLEDVEDRTLLLENKEEH